MKKIAIQGYKGSFHHIVCEKNYNNYSLVECDSFSLLIQKLSNGEVDEAVYAIENLNAGIILQNIILLEKYNIEIISEYWLKLHQNLIVSKNTKIEDIKYIYSHPMALSQSSTFLKTLSNTELIEYSDTAQAVKMISEKKHNQYAAIGSKLASEIYNTHIIKENIENDVNNATRFLLIRKRRNNIDEYKTKTFMIINDITIEQLIKKLELNNIKNICTMPNNSFYLEYLNYKGDNDIIDKITILGSI